jgi:hypothetical protein
MTYELKGDRMLLSIDRTDILDISVNDVITLNGWTGVKYVWTEHDAHFVENNPDDDLFLEMERVGNKYKASGIVLKQR